MHHDGCRWLALCTSPDCGNVIAAPHDDATALKTALLGAAPMHPYRHPALRLFLRAARLRSTSGWQPWPSPCVSCSEDELAFGMFIPHPVPQGLFLCLRCRSLEARYGGPGRYSITRGGTDWIDGDLVVRDARRAIRSMEASELAATNSPEGWDDE
jgi:hypothetical protein